MRRFVKKKLMENISDIIQKHKIMEQEFLKGNYEKVQFLFVQCQEAAIQIGNTIEEDELPNGSIIKKLEEYCEVLYEQSVKLSNCKRKLSYREAKHVFKSVRLQMDKYISNVREYVKNIKERIEVVFFPYKVSMWDSLESVWMAARDDEDCDAYVVPIPYFDKKTDGTVYDDMHYEGEDFPEYVPVVNWEDYDVAARHPDIICIHNPYDQTNNVTTVHLDYYAKELKKHTEKLVYIPYFVCVNDEVLPHLCILPGTLYADKVIVQSEKIRKIYIQEFHKFEEEYNCKDSFGVAEDKFIALGSPKYDKVFSTTKENVEIPDDWLKKIVKEDGSWRKVLLYNTSVSTLLEGKEQVLKKMKSVFELLKNRYDIVLLWRPHPLIKETYGALRPELIIQYDEIVEEYKQENWGIYDDTPDLHRAIAISDAYYGDISSLVELYRQTGKPIMIQNIECL